jgi:restriction system protein
MNADCEEKRRLLGSLVELRRLKSLEALFAGTAHRYRRLGAFHSGAYECDHVSPWSKSGGCPNAPIMIVGQDWSSAEHLEKSPPNEHMINFGFHPKFPTNVKLDELLDQHLGITRGVCYLTNLFPFIKAGSASASIPMRDLKRCAAEFLLPQIKIVRPRVVICLGIATFRALMRGCGQPAPRQLGKAIEGSPYSIEEAMIFAVAHTGSRGLQGRGAEQVARDWARIGAYGRFEAAGGNAKLGVCHCQEESAGRDTQSRCAHANVWPKGNVLG